MESEESATKFVDEFSFFLTKFQSDLEDGLSKPPKHLELHHFYTWLHSLDLLEKTLTDRLHIADMSCGDEEEEEKLAFWKNHHKTLQSFQNALHHTQTSLRKQVNDRSRHHLRSLNLLDLPDEILIIICEQVEQDSWDDLSPSNWGRTGELPIPRDIKNLRLTCGKLSNTSSHLLIQAIGVDLGDESSLAHFEAISKHPTIGKGIATVCINLGFYDPLLAKDFGLFVSLQSEHLETEFYRFFSPRSKAENKLGIPEDVFRQKLVKLETIMDSWESGSWVHNVHDDDGFESWEAPASEVDKKYQEMLREGYTEYQRRFEFQKRQRESKSFVETLGTAMARMPRVRGVMFRDNNFSCRARNGSIAMLEDGDEAMEKAVSRSMLVPLSWSEAMGYQGFGSPPAEIIVESIIAIYKAGVMLKHIDIQIASALDLSTLAPSEENLEVLTAAVQRLQAFDFFITQSLIPWPAREPRELKDLQKLLKAFLQTSSLTGISIDTSILQNVIEGHEHDSTFSIGTIMSSQVRPKLSDLQWSGIPLHITELECFVQKLRPKIRIGGTHLLSGTWADVLDILRNLKSAVLHISSPSGAECEELSEEKIEEIFGHRDGMMSSAEHYIAGYVGSNPLRKPPAEDSNPATQSTPGEESPETEESNATGEPVELPENEELGATEGPEDLE